MGTTVEATSGDGPGPAGELPGRLRSSSRAPSRAHLLAIYGFARLVDDIGDEAEGDRLAQLDWLEAELRPGRRRHGRPTRSSPPAPRRSIDSTCLSILRDLIEANRQDQRVRRVRDLRGPGRLLPCSRPRRSAGWCWRSSGRHPERMALSDDVCIGLQVVEHLQDVAEDAAPGPRLPAPGRPGALRVSAPTELPPPRASPALRRVVAVEAGPGPPSCSPPERRSWPPRSSWRPRLAVAAFTAGGHGRARRHRAAGYDVLGAALPPRRAAIRPAPLARRHGRLGGRGEAA